MAPCIAYRTCACSRRSTSGTSVRCLASGRGVRDGSAPGAGCNVRHAGWPRRARHGTPHQPHAGRHGAYGGCRSTTSRGHDAQGQRRLSWLEPRNSQHGLRWAAPDARLQGWPDHRSQPRPYFADLQCMRRDRRRLAPLASELRVRGMQPHTERGSECGPQHTGVGDWRYCTARGVWTANLYDP